MSFELGDEMKIAACDENIVYIDEKSNGVITNMGKIEIRIRLRLSKLPSKKSGM